MTVILKLTSHDEKDFGYMGMKTSNGKTKFIGGVDISAAAKFKLEKYPKDKDAHYYQVVGQSKHYLDFHITSSVLYSDKVGFAGLTISKICAWKEVDGELHVVIAGEDIKKVVSRSAADDDSKLLYANLLLGDGAKTSCKVEVMDVKEESLI
jgi:hypothetical protein